MHDSDQFREACPEAAPAGTRTILGREAIGYAHGCCDPSRPGRESPWHCERVEA